MCSVLQEIDVCTLDQLRWIDCQHLHEPLRFAQAFDSIEVDARSADQKQRAMLPDAADRAIGQGQ